MRAGKRDVCSIWMAGRRETKKKTEETGEISSPRGQIGGRAAAIGFPYWIIAEGSS